MPRVTIADGRGSLRWEGCAAGPHRDHPAGYRPCFEHPHYYHNRRGLERMKAGRGVDCLRWVIGAFVFLAGNFRGWGARGLRFFQKVPENGPARFFLIQKGRIGMMGSAWPN